MSFTFDPALASPTSRIRQRLGDTDATNVEIQDETIAYYLTVRGGSELAVAYQLALDCAAKYARLVDVTVDHQLTKASQAATAYTKLAERLAGELRNESIGANSGGFVGVLVAGIDDNTGPFDVETLPPAPLYNWPTPPAASVQ